MIIYTHLMKVKWVLTPRGVDDIIKNPKLQLCRQHFPLEALPFNQPPNIVAAKELAAGTAATMDVFL